MSFNIFPWIGQLLSIPSLHVTILFVVFFFFFPQCMLNNLKKTTSSYFHCSVSKKECGVLCGV